ncbi:pheromone/general odorant binding protein, partial [Escherichia coli]
SPEITMLVTIVLAFALCLLRVDASKDVMKSMAINFAKPLAVCKQEMALEDAVIQDFSNFWKEGYELNNRETGCVIICISSKLDLLDEELNLHHGKAMEFAKKHGADEGLAKQLIDLIHNCGQNTPPVPEDNCQSTLNVAKCFKAEIHKLDWAPSMDLIMADLLAEI